MMREWRALWRDRWGMALALWLPLATMLITWWTLSGAIVRELPIGLVDLDNSTMSRQFARELHASPSFNLNHQFSTVTEGSASLRGGEIYALVVIPRHFERDIRQGTLPTVTAWNNGQFVLIAKVINSSLSLVAGTFNGQIAVVQALAQGAAVPEAKGLAMPIGGQITALFNQNSNYAQFLLNAIIPSIWSILLALYGLNTLAREDRHGTHWVPENRAAIGAKFLTHWLIGWAWGGVWSYALYSLLDYPLNGSALLLFASIGVTAGACVALGMAFYALICDPARAVSIVGAAHGSRTGVYGHHLSGGSDGDIRHVLATIAARRALWRYRDCHHQLRCRAHSDRARTGSARPILAAATAHTVALPSQ
ncbi:ABC transporter permease [Pectobacterium carotovorum]|uniref:ABC transporter permease n=1 Tax=Pectobacterium carotovorum TaxID=554 RepID=UPI00027E0F55|nr:ABC transporter permease [Pectobacterium carotovorum]AFR01831.1 hypothetical protein PCC21_004280 [Pectobacterium carotovorum subsp. carotovorum PCC21]